MGMLAKNQVRLGKMNWKRAYYYITQNMYTMHIQIKNVLKIVTPTYTLVSRGQTAIFLFVWGREIPHTKRKNSSLATRVYFHPGRWVAASAT